MMRSRRTIHEDLRAYHPDDLIGNFRFSNDGSGNERIIAMFPRDKLPFFKTDPGVAKMRYASEMTVNSRWMEPHPGVAPKRNQWMQFYLDPVWDASVWLECHGSPWGSPSLFFENPNTGSVGRAPYIAQYAPSTIGTWWNTPPVVGKTSYWRLHIIVKALATDNFNRVFYTDSRTAGKECIEIGYNGSSKKFFITYGEPPGQTTVYSSDLTAGTNGLIPDDGWMRFTVVFTHYAGLFELTSFRAFIEDVEIIPETLSGKLQLWDLSTQFKWLGCDLDRKDGLSWRGWIAQALWIENHPTSTGIVGFQTVPTLESWLHPWLEDPWYFLKRDDFLPASRPVTDFSASPVSGIAPISVTFTNTTVGVVNTWAWSFGDDGTSTAKNPAHLYNSLGVFTVTLTAVGPGGTDIETKTSLITIDVVAGVVSVTMSHNPAVNSRISYDVAVSTDLAISPAVDVDGGIDDGS